MQKAFDYLDAPVVTCTGKDVPMPYAANLEKFALITPTEVVTAWENGAIQLTRARDSGRPLSCVRWRRTTSTSTLIIPGRSGRTP